MHRTVNPKGWVQAIIGLTLFREVCYVHFKDKTLVKFLISIISK